MVFGMKIDPVTLKQAQRFAMWQEGVLTTAQADQLGVGGHTRTRLVEEGAWRRLIPGMYALSPDSWLQRAWAGVLIGGPQASLGMESALCVAGLAKEPKRITVYVGRQAGFPHDDRWQFIRACRSQWSSPRHTSVEEAIIDVGSYWEMDSLITLVGNAVTGRYITPDILTAELDRRPRHRQRRLVREVIDSVATGTTTVLEYHYEHDVEIPHGLPTPLRQAKLFGRYRVDNWYEAYKLIVEVDGKATHVGLAASVDMERDNFHMSHDISTLRFTWSHVVHDPCRTARGVAEALTRAGWTGHIHPCPRCSSRVSPYPA